MKLSKREIDQALTPIRKKHHAFVNKSVIDYINNNPEYRLNVDHRDPLAIGEYVKCSLYFKEVFLCVLLFFFPSNKPVLI